MFLEEIRSIKSEKRDLRNFGITFGIILGVLAGALWWKGKDTYTIFAVLSAAFFFFGLVLPRLLMPLQKVWMVVLGWFMTRLILSVLFYVVFTFIGGGARLFGKKFLGLDIDKSKESYWIYRESEAFEQGKYEKQF